jgi:hypothetical protein
LGQRDNLPKTEYFTCPQKWQHCYQDPGNILQNVIVVNDAMIMASYNKEDEFIEESSKSNVVIASMVTS